MNRMISDEEFKERIAHLTPEAQEGALRDRKRQLEAQALKEATTDGPGKTDWNAWALRVVTILHEKANKRIDAMRGNFATFLGEQFRNFEEGATETIGKELAEIELKADNAIKQFRLHYGKGVRDICAEYARAEARDAVRLARQEDRQTLAALERQIETMAHEIERLKLMGK